MKISSELYTHINKSVKNMTHAIQDIFKSNMSIEDAAEKYEINPDLLKQNLEYWKTEFDEMTKDELSLLSLLRRNEISQSMYKSLKDKYPTIKEFAKMSTSEFCKNLRAEHISANKIIELLDILIKHNVKLKDCNTVTDMAYIGDIMKSLS